MNDSKLVDGKIPVGIECPFRAECPIAKHSACHHRGKEHDKMFSCGAARAFDLIQRYEKPKDVT